VTREVASLTPRIGLRGSPAVPRSAREVARQAIGATRREGRGHERTLAPQKTVGKAWLEDGRAVGPRTGEAIASAVWRDTAAALADGRLLGAGSGEDLEARRTDGEAYARSPRRQHHLVLKVARLCRSKRCLQHGRQVPKQRLTGQRLAR
jgi:hypothetical protein